MLAACLAVAAVALGLIAAGAGAAAAATPSSDAAERARAAEDGVIPGRYIVVYEEDHLDRSVNRETRRRERRLGFESRHRYRHAIEGFAAKLTPRQVRALERDPEVASVSADRRVSIAAEVPLADEEEVPTGVRRVLAATASTAREASGVGVAVLDTAVIEHPDLVIDEGVDCVSEEEDGDVPGDHGTHVAGTIGARNQGGDGVVGVAPGTTIHAVRVLNDKGEGRSSDVICGIAWVTDKADELNIGVANMSLGGTTEDLLGECPNTAADPDPKDPMHKAICDSIAAGVTYVVAAGNDGWAFDDPPPTDDDPPADRWSVPAAYPEVLTVTAMVDSDGERGSAGTAIDCGDPDEEPTPDDSWAPFSNFAATEAGEAHTIAAPGCAILSTYPGGYAIGSGTSMAAPHVAGLVALCIDEAGVEGECAGMTPAEIIVQMRNEAEAYNQAEHPGPGAGLGYGFTGDPLNPFEGQEEYFGFLTVMPGTPPSEPSEPGDDPDSGDDTGGGDSDGDGDTGDTDDTTDSTPPDEEAPAEDSDPESPVVDEPPPTADEPRLVAPSTRITRKPKRVRRMARKRARAKGKKARVRVRFGFRSAQEGVRFRCRVDHRRWRHCSRPFKTRVKRGRHVFRVRAIGRTGLVGPVAKYRFRVRVRRR